MSSHREAPRDLQGPGRRQHRPLRVRQPGQARTPSRFIANYVPLQGPAGGPNFYEFGDDVLYEIHIDNDGDGHADVTYQFRFTHAAARTRTRSSTTPARSCRSTAPNWNRRQFYSVTRIDGAHGRASTVLAQELPCPPCNVGPLRRRTTSLAAAARARRCRRRRRSSPGSAPRASSSTSARSSTSATCGRSRTRTCRPGAFASQRPGVNATKNAQRALASPSRCRSRR